MPTPENSEITNTMDHVAHVRSHFQDAVALKQANEGRDVVEGEDPAASGVPKSLTMLRKAFDIPR